MRPLDASNGMMVPLAAAISFCSYAAYQHTDLLVAWCTDLANAVF